MALFSGRLLNFVRNNANPVATGLLGVAGGYLAGRAGMAPAGTGTPVAATAQAPTGPQRSSVEQAAVGTGFMDRKLMGLPMPVVLIGGGIAAVLIVKKLGIF